jgi:aspartate 1-decarboxylase
MQRIMLQGKLHPVAVTHAELNYIGSCAIDQDLLEAANILPYQQIDIWNVNNGERFTTYAIEGERGSGIISVNGSAERRAEIGDILIIAAFAHLEETELKDFKPHVVFVNERNQITQQDSVLPIQPFIAHEK